MSHTCRKRCRPIGTKSRLPYKEGAGHIWEGGGRIKKVSRAIYSMFYL